MIDIAANSAWQEPYLLLQSIKNGDLIPVFSLLLVIVEGTSRQTEPTKKYTASGHTRIYNE